MMKRQVYLNNVPNVHMYSSESGTNNGNCATSCSGCTVNNGCNDNGGIIKVIATLSTPAVLPSVIAFVIAK